HPPPAPRRKRRLLLRIQCDIRERLCNVSDAFYRVIAGGLLFLIGDGAASREREHEEERRNTNEFSGHGNPPMRVNDLQRNREAIGVSSLPRSAVRNRTASCPPPRSSPWTCGMIDMSR